jgi:hypothetical protein
MKVLRSSFLMFMTGVVMCATTRSGASASSEPSRRKPPSTISVLISPAGWGAEEPHVYPLKKSILVHCLIQNSGKQTVSFPLKDHDPYHGTLPYPVEVSVRIQADNGAVVTANEIDRSGEGWWSQYFVGSTNFDAAMPGDTILLPPGGRVIRLIPIDQVLMMAPEIKGGLQEGTYTIKIRVNGVTSNSIKIKVGPTAP